MENYCSGTSVNSILLLKERIIKVETLLKKYACLAKKFNDLEKSHSDLAENEKSAKKDAAKYLEKYCKLSKKCSALLSKIKNLEALVKEKTDLVAENENELAKLESVLRIYKTERSDFLNLRKDKTFLLTLVCKLLKDSKVESKDSKTKRNVETFYKRFERDLEVLKLDDFKYIKPKKILKSQAEELEASTFSVELPVLNSVESGFIDVDVASESANSLSNEEVHCLRGEVHEFTEKPSDSCADKKCDSALFGKNDSSHHNYIPMTNDGFLKPSNSEKYIKIQTEEFCFDVYSSINENLGHDTINEDTVGSTSNSNHSNCPPVLKKQVSSREVTKESEARICENCNDFGEKKNKISLALDEKILKGSDMKEIQNDSSDFCQLHNCSSSHENFEFKAALEKPYFCCKQYMRKTATNLDNICAIEKDVTNPEINCLKFPSEGSKPKFVRINEDLKPGVDELIDDNNGATTEIKKSENSGESLFLFTGENNSLPDDVGGPENVNHEPSNIYRNALVELDRINEEQCVKASVKDKQEKYFNEDLEEEKSGRTKFDINIEGISNKEMTLEAKGQCLNGDTSIFESKRKNVISAESVQEVSDIEIFRILEIFKPVKLITPIKRRQHKGNSKRDKLLLKSTGKLSPQKLLNKDKINIVAEKVKTLKDTSLVFGNEALKKIFVDVSTQTDDVVIIQNKGTRDQNTTEKVKLKKPSTVPITKGIVRKIVRKIWKGKLKKILRNLDEFTKIWKSHHCSNIHLKSILNHLDVRKCYHEKCEREVLCGMLRSCFIKSRYKNKIKAVKNKLTKWNVEDTTEMKTFSSPNQYLLGFNGKVNNFGAEYAVYNDLKKGTSNKCLPPGQELHMQHLDWMSNRRINYIPPGDIFESAFTRGIPESILLREISLRSAFKKENENFRSLPVDNYVNVNEPFSRSDCIDDMLDMKDVSLRVVHCDGPKLRVPENDDEDKIEIQNENNFSSHAGSMDLQKCTVVPRRNSRFQDGNNGITFVNMPPKCESDFPGFPNTNKPDIGNEFRDKNITHDLPSPVRTDHCENSNCIEDLETSENMKEFSKPIFHETASPQPTKIIPAVGDGMQPKEPKNSPKVPYNLRRIGKNFKPVPVGNHSTKNVQNLRTSSRFSTNLTGDSYYRSEEEIEKTRETQTTVPEKNQESINFLDSIMTAMTKQAEEFKPKIRMNMTSEKDRETNAAGIISTPELCSIPFSAQHGIYNTHMGCYNSSPEASHQVNIPDGWKSEQKNQEQCIDVISISSKKGNKMRKIVENELSKFLKAEIKSVEEGEEKLKPCIAVLEKATECDVASAIVAEVMANVDEELQDFDRPAPPLTQTQHRLMTILTILTNSCENFSQISYTILKTIWTKLFPDNFFWPDDSIEMASRFYSALCKKLNYFKGMWKFCFKAVSTMRQRWCIPIFVVFQIWPDILHNATDIKDNILVKAFVNVILHTPKSENLRRKGQEEKILAIKHLLINFYNFDVNLTIEELARQLFQALHTDTPGIADALIFVTKCRQWAWIRKNIISPLIDNLKSWSNGKITDECSFKLMEIIREISSVFPLVEENETVPSAKNVISTLYQLLPLASTNPNKEAMIIRTLCSLGHHTGVRDILSALSNKFPREDPLYSEIKKAINSSFRKRKQCLKNLKIMSKIKEKFNKRKEEMKKKRRKKVKKKPKVKVADN